MMKRLSYSIDLQNDNFIINAYGNLQQEVELGVRALKSGRADMAVTLFQSALQKLPAGQPFHDQLIHNLLLSYKLLIEQLFNAGEKSAAVKFLNRALNLEISKDIAEDNDFRRRFAGAFQDLGIVFFKYKHFEESVLCCRKAIAIYQAPSSYVNLTNSLSKTSLRAELADFTIDLKKEQLGTHIFIACVPKSGSTFLKNLLVSLTGFRDVFMVYAAGQTEHEIYLPTLRETAHFDTVTQQHCRASDANVHLMQAFEIKPIVLVRNVFDSVMSLLDFYNKGAFFNSYFRCDYQSLDEETKIDLLIDNVIPWYFQFVASWSLVEKQKSLDIFWLSYEDMIADKCTAIQNVLGFYGLGAARRSIEQKIKEIESERRNIRFNKGVAGRGDVHLNEQQKERIRRLSKYYPGTDFSRIGL